MCKCVKRCSHVLNNTYVIFFVKTKYEFKYNET